MKCKIGYSVSKKEKESWKTTLVKTSQYLENIPNIDKQYILLEFRIPNRKKRIDVILVGKNNESKNLLIIELKGWSKIYSIKNSNFLGINASYKKSLHPASEALEYLEILKNQFDDINNIFSLKASALLPNYKFEKHNPLEDKKYLNLNTKVPTFTSNNISLFMDYAKNLFNEPINEEDVNKLNELEYKPSLSFLEHLKNEFKNISLIGSQRIAFEKIKDILNRLFLFQSNFISI